MRHIEMRANNSRAMNEKSKVMGATSQHSPQIDKGAGHKFHIIIKTLDWYKIALEIPGDCTVFVLENKKWEEDWVITPTKFA
jgi:hypothetical protein